MNMSKVKKIYAFLIIFIITFAFYGNSIQNKYAVDDAIAITQNKFTKQGLAGIDDILTNDAFTGFFGKKKNLVSGGRYRPLSLITLAIEYEFLGLNPHVSHLINVLLYTWAGILIFLILSHLFKTKDPPAWYYSMPLIITLLYIAHPVHTEAVTNIKGRDEIMAMLGSLLAFLFTLKAIDTKKLKYYVYSGIVFFLGLMSKENTVTFIAVIPLAIYIFRDEKPMRVLGTLLPLIFSFVIFFLIRQSVVGELIKDPPNELMNNPFLEASETEKYATIFYTLFIYLKLLIWPDPLTYDYYPYHIPLTDWGDPKAFMPAILYAILFIWMAMYIIYHLFHALIQQSSKPKKGGIITFSVFYYLITLSIVSNIPFTIGAFMNERFLFMPSLGFSILSGYLIYKKIPLLIPGKTKQRPVVMGIVIIILALYGFKTIDRNTDWKDDFTLFTSDVQISSGSAKSNCTAGGKLLEKAKTIENEQKKNEYLERSIEHLREALRIHPTYKDPMLLLGNAHFAYNRNYDSAVYYYKKLLRRNPRYDLAYNNIHKIFTGYDNVDYKIKVYEELIKINPNRFEVNYQLGNLYGKEKKNLTKALYYLKRAAKINPRSKKTWKDLGVAYGMSGKTDQSIQALQKAIRIDPDDPQLYINLSISYKMKGNALKAREYLIKGKQLKQK